MRSISVVALAVLAFVFAVSQAGAAEPQPSPQRPNIVFIFADDHAAHAISAYGSKINRTPNIDRITKNGMLFRNAFCANSICSPSRATILTGKHSHMNGVYNVADWFDGGQPTFPKLLQQAGYQTAMIGKWHLASDPTGFDYWNILVGQGPYYNPPMFENGVRTKHTGYTTDIITDLSLKWLKEQRD
ncbi:MAG: sulfatase-like hydrolase/transferase, partial [Tepidisphaeraceae bacterium]